MANKFFTKRCELMVFERLGEALDSMEHDRKFKYDTLGTQHQDKNWRTGELQWVDDEHTIPKMVDDWGEVEKSPEDYTEEDKGILAAIANIRAHLEDLL